MAKRVIIVHGWDGSPTSDWIGWAREAFQEIGYEAIAPQMPGADRPVIRDWVEKLRYVTGRVDEHTYFIGHSIGCQAIMRFVETLDTKVGGAIFVSGWFRLQNLESKEEEKIAKPWIETPIDCAKVRANLARSVLMLGSRDPWVPYEETKNDFETRLGSEVITIPGAGHLTSDDGFGHFHQLIDIFENRFVAHLPWP